MMAALLLIISALAIVVDVILLRECVRHLHEWDSDHLAGTAAHRDALRERFAHIREALFVHELRLFRLQHGGGSRVGDKE